MSTAKAPRRRQMVGRGLASAMVMVICAAATTMAAAAQESPLVLSAVAEPASVTIGTPFRYTVRIESDTDVEILMPLLAEHVGEFLITDFGENDPREDGVTGAVAIERWYTLIGYKTGELLIPGSALQYRDSSGELATDYFPDAHISVTSLLTAATEDGRPAALRDIKGPLAAPLDRLWFWLAVSTCGGLALAATALWWWSSRARRTLATPAPLPHETALAKLTELRHARLLEDRRHDEYYVRLSALVRDYVEARFELRAPEMTTDEFLSVAQRDSRLAAADRASLQSFLGEADLVKFARYVPDLSAAENAWTAARDFVEHTALATPTPDEEVGRASA